MLHFGSGFVLSQTVRHGDFIGVTPSLRDFGYAIAAGFALMSLTCVIVIAGEKWRPDRKPIS
jgi:hypothetical protein